MSINSIQPTSILSSYLWSNQRLNNLLQQLATGDRLTRPSIDPSAFVASETFRSQMGGFEAADRSIQYGRTMTSLADATLSNVGDSLNNIQRLTIEIVAHGGGQVQHVRSWHAKVNIQ